MALMQIVNFKASAELRANLHELAQAHGRNLSAEIRACIEEAVERHQESEGNRPDE